VLEHICRICYLTFARKIFAGKNQSDSEICKAPLLNLSGRLAIAVHLMDKLTMPFFFKSLPMVLPATICYLYFEKVSPQVMWFLEGQGYVRTSLGTWEVFMEAPSEQWTMTAPDASGKACKRVWFRLGNNNDTSHISSYNGNTTCWSVLIMSDCRKIQPNPACVITVKSKM